jgi:hypothetical protein
MDSNLHRAHASSGASGSFLYRQTLPLGQIERLDLGRRELRKSIAQFRVLTGTAFHANLRKFIEVCLDAQPLAVAAQMLGGNLAENRKEPGLKRPLWLKSMSGLVHGQECFLADVLDFGFICQAAAQKLCDQRTNFSKQRLEGLAIASLSALHELCPAGAVLALGRH